MAPDYKEILMAVKAEINYELSNINYEDVEEYIYYEDALTLVLDEIPLDNAPTLAAALADIGDEQAAISVEFWTDENIFKYLLVVEDKCIEINDVFECESFEEFFKKDLA